MKSSREYEQFDRTMRKLISVPHERLKAALDAEKRAKEKRKSRTSASGRASRAKD